MVFLVGAASFAAWLLVRPATPVRYATVLGERRTEALADGTHVTLNTDSVIEVP